MHKVIEYYVAFWKHNGNVAFIFHACAFLVVLMWLWHRFVLRIENRDKIQRESWLHDALGRDYPGDE